MREGKSEQATDAGHPEAFRDCRNLRRRKQPKQPSLFGAWRRRYHVARHASLEQCHYGSQIANLPQGEAKWSKVSKYKLAAYKRIVDVLFDNDDLVHFHSLVVDTTLLDDHKFNAGSREIGFNKEIYQLAMKFSRLYPKEW